MMVVSTSKAAASSRDYEDKGYYSWHRHYRKSLKTLLTKIWLLMWAQCVSIKEALEKKLEQVCTYIAILNAEYLVTMLSMAY